MLKHDLQFLQHLENPRLSIPPSIQRGITGRRIQIRSVSSATRNSGSPNFAVSRGHACSEFGVRGTAIRPAANTGNQRSRVTPLRSVIAQIMFRDPDSYSFRLAWKTLSHTSQ